MTKVLVVDDEPALRDLIRAVLEDEGYQVVTAENGRRALELLRQDRPDLVLTDLMMPVMGGHELLRHLRSMPELDRIPVIVMSTARAAVSIDAAAAFVPKPFDIDQLLAAIRAVLRH